MINHKIIPIIFFALLISCGSSSYKHISKDSFKAYLDSNSNKVDGIEGLWTGYYIEDDPGDISSRNGRYSKYDSLKVAIIKNDEKPNSFIIISLGDVNYQYKYGGEPHKQFRTYSWTDKILANINKINNEYELMINGQNKGVYLYEGTSFDNALILTTEKIETKTKKKTNDNAADDLISSLNNSNRFNGKTIYRFQFTKDYPMYYSVSILNGILQNKDIKNKQMKEDIDDFIRNGKDINSKDENGLSPIHYSVRNCNYEITEYLLQMGANANSKTEKYSVTPLMFLSDITNSCNINKFVDLLISNGADVNARTVSGYTAIMFFYSDRTKNAVSSYNEEHKKIIEQKYSLFEEYLIEKGAETSGIDSLHQLNLSKWLDVLNNKKIQEEQLKINQQEIDRKRKALSKTDKEKIKTEVLSLKSQLVEVKNKKDFYQKENERYSNLLNKNNSKEMKKEYQEQLKLSGESVMSAEIVIKLIEIKLVELYNLVPESK